MNCIQCGGALTADARFCSHCGAAVRSERATVETGGGAYVGGSVSAGRDFTGRDRGGDTSTTGFTGPEVAALFDAVHRRIESRPNDAHVDRKDLNDIVQKLQLEAAKGDQADESKLARWLRFLADMAPDVWKVAVATMANPAAGFATIVQKVAARSRQPATDV